MVRFRSFGLTAARVAAVGFALAVLAWLVVSAQRRASVDESPVPPPVSTATTPAVDAGSATSVVTDPSARSGDVFLRTSKSGAPDVLLPILPASSTPVPPPTDADIFLGTSKSLDLSESGVLTEITVPPASTSPPATGTAPAKEPPVFLPSSKVLSPGDATRPILRPGDTLPKPAPAKPKP